MRGSYLHLKTLFLNNFSERLWTSIQRRIQQEEETQSRNQRLARGRRLQTPIIPGNAPDHTLRTLTCQNTLHFQNIRSKTCLPPCWLKLLGNVKFIGQAYWLNDILVFSISSPVARNRLKGNPIKSSIYAGADIFSSRFQSLFRILWGANWLLIVRMRDVSLFWCYVQLQFRPSYS